MNDHRVGSLLEGRYQVRRLIARFTAPLGMGAISVLATVLPPAPVIAVFGVLVAAEYLWLAWLLRDPDAGLRLAHLADREERREVEEPDEPVGEQRQEEHLQPQGDDHHARGLAHPGEVGSGERQAESEHDDADGDGEPDGQGRRLVDARRLPEVLV